ncbi:hypothetical protein ADIS_0069 [Lunatimonas lonarensis]|uniref:Uncharacterized protein n=1 Tax=Lunatimonas lonarensis TaxID=1232681 RepID=R7ZZE9_9BACT|nr:hypothetical protein ADIS_0069 [Lunatimonas lonarensis]
MSNRFYFESILVFSIAPVGMPFLLLKGFGGSWYAPLPVLSAKTETEVNS